MGHNPEKVYTEAEVREHFIKWKGFYRADMTEQEWLDFANRYGRSRLYATLIWVFENPQRRHK